MSVTAQAPLPWNTYNHIYLSKFHLNSERETEWFEILAVKTGNGNTRLKIRTRGEKGASRGVQFILDFGKGASHRRNRTKGVVVRGNILQKLLPPSCAWPRPSCVSSRGGNHNKPWNSWKRGKPGLLGASIKVKVSQEMFFHSRVCEAGINSHALSHIRFSTFWIPTLITHLETTAHPEFISSWVF